MGEYENEVLADVMETFKKLVINNEKEVAKIRKKGEEEMGKFLDLFFENIEKNDGKLSEDTVFKQTLKEFKKR